MFTRSDLTMLMDAKPSPGALGRATVGTAGEPGQPRHTEAGEIVKAAHLGRIETLMLAQGAELWGRFDEATGKVRMSDQAEAAGFSFSLIRVGWTRWRAERCEADRHLRRASPAGPAVRHAE